MRPNSSPGAGDGERLPNALVWGALIAGTDEPQPLRSATEDRLAGIAELIATAMCNATASSEPLAPRARIVEAAGERRRRVVRDLHDGAQQRLVHAVMTLQLACVTDDAPPGLERLPGEGLDDTRPRSKNSVSSRAADIPP
jgi:signal transduction histidine kinase